MFVLVADGGLIWRGGLISCCRLRGWDITKEGLLLKK